MRPPETKAETWAAYIAFFLDHDGGCNDPYEYDPYLLEAIQKAVAIRLALKMVCEHFKIPMEEVLKIARETVMMHQTMCQQTKESH